MPNKNRREKIQERITNLTDLGIIPADEAQLNIDVVYNSVLDQICSVVPVNSPRQVVSALRLVYGSKNKSMYNDKDVYESNLMGITGNIYPITDGGYPTNNVEFETTGNTFVGSYKNIIPGTLTVSRGNAILKDDLNGNLVGADGNGKVDYEAALISIEFNNTNINKPELATKVSYKFNQFDIETSRNFVQFKKVFIDVFSDLYQLDIDSAVILNEFKGVNLRENIDKIIPEVLAQQIDTYVLHKYFDHLNTIENLPQFDATNDYKAIDVAKAINEQLYKFTENTNVVPNIILCDPKSYSVLKTARGFVPVSMLHIDKDYEYDVTYSGTPRFVGYFDTTKVFLVNFNDNSNSTGKIVITYKGPSDAQSAMVYTQFIPVSLRKVTGMEGSGMINTTNIYSIGGSTIINPELISGMEILII